MFCDHNEKLASRGQKKIKKFVMLIFFIFDADSLGTFYLRLLYEEMTKIKFQKSSNNYVCECCDYNTSRLSQYNRHITTSKHLILINTNEMKPKSSDTNYTCECGKQYMHASSLWNHKQKCNFPSQDKIICNTIQYDISNETQTSLILELVKQNQEFKDLLIQQSNQMIEQNKTIIEVAKNSHVNNTINNHSNSHNKTFNLQFFLNETCKDAMNMKDFIKSLELSLPELEKMGELGFAEGMSRVFVNRLNNLDITKRPIHCSDVKREIIHIKDDNKWERDNANLDRLRKIIKQLTHKNILRVDDWKKANPGCTEYNSRKNDQYLKLNMEVIGPVDEAEVKRDFGKIIRRVAENTAIDKKYLCM